MPTTPIALDPAIIAWGRSLEQAFSLNSGWTEPTPPRTGEGQPGEQPPVAPISEEETAFRRLYNSKIGEISALKRMPFYDESGGVDVSHSLVAMNGFVTAKDWTKATAALGRAATTSEEIKNNRRPFAEL